MADHWVHNLSPFIIEFGPGWGIRWYGMAYLAGIAWGYWMFVRWVRARRVPLAPAEIQDFVLSAGLGMIIGGRLGYCLLYEPRLTFTDPFYLFRVWDGGMASHGGMLGLFVGTWLYARKRGRSTRVLIDAVTATAPIGVACGRLANFINGELWGRATDVPWAVIFPGSVQAPRGLDAAAAHAWQVAHAVPRHPSQLYAMALEGLLLLLILLPLHARHRRPGLTTAVFCAAYAVARFCGEFFREPDAGYALIFGWMSKGQAYSLPLLALGVAWAVWTLRRPARPELYPLPTAAAPAAPGAPTPRPSTPGT